MFVTVNLKIHGFIVPILSFRLWICLFTSFIYFFQISAFILYISAKYFCLIIRTIPMKMVWVSPSEKEAMFGLIAMMVLMKIYGCPFQKWSYINHKLF